MFPQETRCYSRVCLYYWLFRSAEEATASMASGIEEEGEEEEVGEEDDEDFGIVTIDYETKEGTAKEERHYMPVGGTLVFQVRERERLID